MLEIKVYKNSYTVKINMLNTNDFIIKYLLLTYSYRSVFYLVLTLKH